MLRNQPGSCGLVMFYGVEVYLKDFFFFTSLHGVPINVSESE